MRDGPSPPGAAAHCVVARFRLVRGLHYCPRVRLQIVSYAGSSETGELLGAFTAGSTPTLLCGINSRASLDIFPVLTMFGYVLVREGLRGSDMTNLRLLFRLSTHLFPHILVVLEGVELFAGQVLPWGSLGWAAGSQVLCEKFLELELLATQPFFFIAVFS